MKSKIFKEKNNFNSKKYKEATHRISKTPSLRREDKKKHNFSNQENYKKLDKNRIDDSHKDKDTNNHFKDKQKKNEKIIKNEKIKETSSKYFIEQNSSRGYDNNKRW